MLNFDENIRSELPHARYLVLELAALLDRLDTAAGKERVSAGADSRLKALRAALAILNEPTAKSDRVERILRADSET